jgi:hypothetical protein
MANTRKKYAPYIIIAGLVFIIIPFFGILEDYAIVGILLLAFGFFSLRKGPVTPMDDLERAKYELDSMELDSAFDESNSSDD